MSRFGGYQYAFAQLRQISDENFQITDESLTALEKTLKDIVEGISTDRGTLNANQDLNNMTARSWNGYWTIGSANANPNLPATPGVVGKLTVQNTNNDKYMRIDFRFGGGSYERVGYGSDWGPWSRTDAPFIYHGQPPSDITALSQLRQRRHLGEWRIMQDRNYTDLPSGLEGRWNAGGLTNLTDGSSVTKQLLSINFQGGGGLFIRHQTGNTGIFSDWFPLGGGGGPEDSERIKELESKIALLQSMQEQPETTFENTNIFTTYDEGEAYMDWVGQKYKDRVNILNLGKSRQGRAIRAFELGDPTKPTYYLMAAQHGSEPMGREAAYLWVRELCQSNDTKLQTFLRNACIVVAPVINADMINVQRLSSSNTDLNSNWTTQTTAEIQAAASVFKTHNVVLTLDAHEGGKWLTMEAETPNAPEVHQGLKDVSNALYRALDSAFKAENEAFDRFPGAGTLTTARNVIAHRYKSATILLEGTSSLDTNMYQPDVVNRRKVYLLAYRSVFAYLLNNLNDFIAAKTAA